MGSRNDGVEQGAPHAAAAPEASAPSFTDAERYQWIRGHRGDPVIDRALSNSNLDADFDRRIDAAIEMSRSGSRQPITMSAEPGADPITRRRAEAAGEAPPSMSATATWGPTDPALDADDQPRTGTHPGPKWH